MGVLKKGVRKSAVQSGAAEPERVWSTVDNRIGARIAMRRLELQLTQLQLADTLGVSQQQVQRYEKGLARIPASKLGDVARALQAPIQFFLEGVSGTEKSNATFAVAADCPQAAELLRTFSRIKSAPVRKRVVALVRSLAKQEDD